MPFPPSHDLFGGKVACAWTMADLAIWRTCIETLRRYQEFKIAIVCNACGHAEERTIRLPGLEMAANFLARKLAEVGQGATPWIEGGHQ